MRLWGGGIQETQPNFEAFLLERLQGIDSPSQRFDVDVRSGHVGGHCAHDGRQHTFVGAPSPDDDQRGMGGDGEPGLDPDHEHREWVDLQKVAHVGDRTKIRMTTPLLS